MTERDCKNNHLAPYIFIGIYNIFKQIIFNIHILCSTCLFLYHPLLLIRIIYFFNIEAIHSSTSNKEKTDKDIEKIASIWLSKAGERCNLK